MRFAMSNRVWRIARRVMQDDQTKRSQVHAQTIELA